MAGRRQQILDTATLFAARGFHGVSVADLGAACGISGPALYKHFDSKDAMLAEMLVSISEELLRVGRERAAVADPEEALCALVAWHVEFALHNKPLIVVQDRLGIAARAGTGAGSYASAAVRRPVGRPASWSTPASGSARRGLGRTHASG